MEEINDILEHHIGQCGYFIGQAIAQRRRDFVYLIEDNPLFVPIIAKTLVDSLEDLEFTAISSVYDNGIGSVFVLVPDFRDGLPLYLM